MPLSWVRNPFVVQTIDTTAFLSSDPAGLTYIPGSEPGTGRIILVDSEIDERPFYKLNNMFTLTESGEFVGATNLVSGVTREPTGIAYSADANLLFITDDDQHTISIVSATNPSVRLGSIDVSAISSDTEDPFFDNSSGHLFFLEGGTGINPRTIFECTTTGQIISSIVLSKKVGDVEAMTFDSVHNVFYVSGGNSPNIFVVSRDGTTILDTITVLSGLTNPISGIAVAPKGLVLAPSSNPGDDPSVMSLWVADYGKDQKMDGRLFEICMGGWDGGSPVTVPGDADLAPNTVAENAAIGTTVGITAFASDADATLNGVTYSLSDNAGGRFAIDATTGVVTVAGVINREVAGASLGIEVTATSQDGSSAVKAFTIAVEDANEFAVTVPTDTNLAPNTVVRNAAIGTTVGITAFASDADATTNGVTYSLSDNAGGRFAINPTTGVVTVAGALDLAGASLGIEVTATSQDGSSAVKALTIAIEDANEFPVTVPGDADLAPNTVAENAAIGTTVGITAFASDADATLNGVTYSLSDNAGGRFAIDATTGVVTVAGVINREVVGASLGIEVTATSQDGSSAVKAFTIAVEDANEFAVTVPTDTNLAPNTVAENAAVGTTVGITAFASDADATTNGVTYSLSDNAGGRFAINPTTGVVTVAGALDYALSPTHAIAVHAVSADGSFADSLFSIDVQKVSSGISVILSGGNDTYVSPTNDNYIIDGRGGNDSITTGLGADRITGGAGNDTIQAGGGNDVILYGTGSNGYDSIDGGAGGHDVVLATANGVTIGLSSVTGIEVIDAGGFSNVTIEGASSDDNFDFSSVSLIGIASINSGPGNDTVFGSTGADVINGGTGNDLLIGGAGNDVFKVGGSAGTDSYDGGADFDTIEASKSAISLVVTGTNITGIEAISSGGFSGFKLVGTGSANVLDFSAISLIGVEFIDAGAGNDVVIGSAGADAIIGGSGRDTLTGGAGNDTFIFTSTSQSTRPSTIDIITDFHQGEDRIDLSGIDANTVLAG